MTTAHLTVTIVGLRGRRNGRKRRRRTALIIPAVAVLSQTFLRSFLRQSEFLLWCRNGWVPIATVRHWVRTVLTQGMLGTTRTVTIAEMKACGSGRPCPWPSHRRGRGRGGGGGGGEAARPYYGTNMSLFFVWMSGDLLSLFMVSHFIWNGMYTG
jgi:hypothetical protein